MTDKRPIETRLLSTRWHGTSFSQDASEAAAEIARLQAVIVGADREIKRCHAEADAYRAEIADLRAALAECADDLSEWVEEKYKNTKDYPSEARRYERDIGPVRRARALAGK